MSWEGSDRSRCELIRYENLRENLSNIYFGMGGLEVLTEVTLKSIILCGVSQCNSVEVYPHSGEPYCLQLR
jgi:hypothetical protein